MSVTYNTATESHTKQLARGLVNGGATIIGENITSANLSTLGTPTSTYPEFYQDGGAGDTVLTTMGGSLPNWVTDAVLHNSTANLNFGVSSTGAGVVGTIVQARQINTNSEGLQSNSFSATYVSPLVAPPQTKQINTALWAH